MFRADQAYSRPWPSAGGRADRAPSVDPRMQHMMWDFFGRPGPLWLVIGSSSSWSSRLCSPSPRVWCTQLSLYTLAVRSGRAQLSRR